eukprot:4132394-Lingulodinium_polyedra.AAC.1
MQGQAHERESAYDEGRALADFKFAPFLSENSFNEIKGCLQSYIQKGSPKDSLFAAVYSDICRDMN